jgi:hypothetical protein
MTILANSVSISIDAFRKCENFKTVVRSKNAKISGSGSFPGGVQFINTEDLPKRRRGIRK